MRALYLLSVWVHILAAMAWIGGTIFLSLVVVPLLRRPEYRSIMVPMIQLTGRRFRWVGWVCLVLLLITGSFNLYIRGFGLDALTDGRLWQGVLGLKLSLFLLILLISLIHDFYIGPRAVLLMQSAPSSSSTKAFRKATSWAGRVNLLLALAVVALAVMLVRGGP